MLNKKNHFQPIIRTLFMFAAIITSHLTAQGITVPDTPSQAPIGGLGYLALLGGAMAYKKLRNKK